ncbi:hypothetical protein ACFYPT_39060 [Streptomyces sp. NPDC005529]|uniref:hypothetical protein n=1 Tax=unclassified Streptomyces TaxID=2593676 RepID=UPI0033B501F2
MEEHELVAKLQENLGDMWTLIEKVRQDPQEVYLFDAWEAWCQVAYSHLWSAASLIYMHLTGADESSKRDFVDYLKTRNGDGFPEDDSEQLLWAAHELSLIFPEWQYSGWFRKELQTSVQVQYTGDYSSMPDTHHLSGSSREMVPPRSVSVPPAPPQITESALQQPKQHAKKKKKKKARVEVLQVDAAPPQKSRQKEAGAVSGRGVQQKRDSAEHKAPDTRNGKPRRKQSALKSGKNTAAAETEAGAAPSAPARDRPTDAELGRPNTFIQVPGKVFSNDMISPADVVQLVYKASLLPAGRSQRQFLKHLLRCYADLAQGKKSGIRIGKKLMLTRDDDYFILSALMEFQSAESVWQAAGSEKLRYWAPGGELLLMPDQVAEKDPLHYFMDKACASGRARKDGRFVRHMLVATPQGKDAAAEAAISAWRVLLEGVKPRYKLKVVAPSEI